MNDRNAPSRFAYLTLVLAAGAWLHGQNPPAEADSQANAMSVFVPDSPTAIERLALAEKLAGAGEWNKATEIYQELLEQYRDRVAPMPDETQDQPTIYISIADRVQLQLAGWPSEGRLAYIGRYQPAADSLLQAAQTDDQLLAVIERYPLTPAAQTAATRLMERWWRQGEMIPMARLAERAIQILPPDSPDRPQLLFRSALGWQVAGNSERSTRLLQQLQQNHPLARGIVGGETVVLAEKLGQLLADTTPPPSSGESSAIPRRADALLFSVELNAMQPKHSPQPRPNADQGMGIFPASDGRELYFHDGLRLYAMDLESGVKLPGWQNKWVELARQPNEFGLGLRALAISEDNVYVVVSDPLSPAWIGGHQQRMNRSMLICVSRADGSEQWRITPEGLSKDHPSLNNIQLASTPLIAGDAIYLAARAGKNAQFQDIFLLRFDLHTGTLNWASYLASGPNLATAMMETMPYVVDGSLPQLAAHGGRIFVVTNVGAIAAVEQRDGALAWLRVYTRLSIPPATMAGRRIIRTADTDQTPRIFAPSPPLFEDGQLIALPVDGADLLVLHEADGRTTKLIPRTSFGNADTLVGMHESGLVLAGPRSATVLDWKLAEPNAADQKPAIRWTMEFSGNTLRGRPFLDGESLFLPSDDRLMRISTRNWKIEQTTPAYPQRFSGKQGPGNVLVANQHVVVIGRQQANVYTNLDFAKSRLDREVAGDPNSPEPLVRYGELLFAAADHEAALKKFKAATILAADSPRDDQIRDRLFQTLLSDGLLLTTDAANGGSPLAGEFLEVARLAIATAAHAVDYHLTMATLSSRRNDGAATLQHLQNILDHQQQRQVLARDKDGLVRPAGQIAKRRIQELIDRYGSAIYQATEQAARDAIDAARQSQSAAELINVAERYPNSASALLAKQTAAQIHEQQGQFVQAAAILREASRSCPSEPEVIASIEAMARVYAAIEGKADVAAERLKQAASLYHDPTTTRPIHLPGGRVIPIGRFSEVAKAIREAAAPANALPLADLRLPLRGGEPYDKPRPIEGLSVGMILPPIDPEKPDYEHVVIRLLDGLIAVVDSQGQVKARFSHVTDEVPRQYGWISSSRLLLRSDSEVVLLDVNKAGVIWKMRTGDLPAISAPQEMPLAQQIEDGPDGAMHIAIAAAAHRPGTIPSNPLAIAKIAATHTQLILGLHSGRIIALDLSTGKPQWQQWPEVGSIGQLEASDEFTVATFVNPRQSALLALDNSGGQAIYRRRVPPTGIQSVLLCPDGRLIYTMPSRLVCKDLFEAGERLAFDVALADSRMFMHQNGDGRLAIVADRIVATGKLGREVFLFSKEDGRPIPPKGQSGLAPVVSLVRPTGSIKLVPADPYVYVVNRTDIQAIHVPTAQNTERRLPTNARQLATLTPGVSHLLAIEHAPAGPASKTVKIYGFSRAPGKTGESGRLDHLQTIDDPKGFTHVQPVNGGLFLRTGDGRLLLLKAKSDQSMPAKKSI